MCSPRRSRLISEKIRRDLQEAQTVLRKEHGCFCEEPDVSFIWGYKSTYYLMIKRTHSLYIYIYDLFRLLAAIFPDLSVYFLNATIHFGNVPVHFLTVDARFCSSCDMFWTFVRAFLTSAYVSSCYCPVPDTIP